jgi:hypothetical protein
MRTFSRIHEKNDQSISIVRSISHWAGPVQEIVLVVVLYGVYTLMQGLMAPIPDIAIQHAHNVIAFEQSLNIYHELSVQSWVLQYPFLLHLADSIYTYCFYPVICLFAIWGYTRHRQQYYVVRNIFLVSTAIGLICFAVFPTAPPRLTPGAGFVDTLALHEAVHYSSSMPKVLVNQYAAIPSFHFGWTLLVGVATVVISRRWWLRMLGALLPLSIFFSIVATGNHYFLDAAAGAAVIGLAYGVVKIVQSWVIPE